MIEETRLLLELWQPGMTTPDLQQAALASGQFPKITARRLRNLVVEGFAPCYLVDRGAPAMILKQVQGFLTRREFEQLLFILHFAGMGDNAVLVHPDWTLFGLERMDVLEEMKRLALKGLLIVQSAGRVTKISWQIGSMEGLIDVLAHDEL